MCTCGLSELLEVLEILEFGVLADKRTSQVLTVRVPDPYSCWISLLCLHEQFRSRGLGRDGSAGRS